MEGPELMFLRSPPVLDQELHCESSVPGQGSEVHTPRKTPLSLPHRERLQEANHLGM